jgi:hypothetical protein
MKKLYKIILTLTLPVLLFSCAALKNEKTPITDEEYAKLLQFARSTIDRLPVSKLSRSDKKFISETLPTKMIKYTAFKQGSVTLDWKFENGKQVKYVAEGDIMNFASSFRSINVFDISISSSIRRH